jgi:hypothetical protein
MLPSDELRVPFVGLDWTIHAEPMRLHDGGRVDVTLSGRDGILITRTGASGSLVDAVRRTAPDDWFAGGGTLLSPSQRYLVLHYYGGQSEEAFVLVDLTGGLSIVGAPGYQVGEHASYAFSPGETRLLMALPMRYGDGDWWMDHSHEDLARDDNGHTYLEFATMVTCDCASGAVRAAPLVVAPDITEPPPESYDFDLDPRFVDETTVRLSMPWGETSVVVSDPLSRMRVVNPLA